MTRAYQKLRMARRPGEGYGQGRGTVGTGRGGAGDPDKRALDSGSTDHQLHRAVGLKGAGYPSDFRVMQVLYGT